MISDAQLSTAIPAGSDDWSADNATGRAFAQTVVSEMRTGENPVLLGRVIRSIVETGKYGEVEVGFCQRLAELAMRD